MYPHERSLVKDLKDEPFAIVGVNSDNAERYRSAVEREEITWRSFYDGGAVGGPIATEWAIEGWPRIFLLDHEGVIRDINPDDLDSAIENLLAKVPGRTPAKSDEDRNADENADDDKKDNSE